MPEMFHRYKAQPCHVKQSWQCESIILNIMENNWGKGESIALAMSSVSTGFQISAWCTFSPLG